MSSILLSKLYEQLDNLLGISFQHEYFLADFFYLKQFNHMIK